MDKLLERFLQYVSLDTQSKPGVRQVPSTEGQWKLLRLLQAQLEEMGLVKVTLSEKGTVMGTLPANVEGDIPAIGFISHVDTSPDFSGKNVNPVSYTHLRAHETRHDLVCRLLLEKKKTKKKQNKIHPIN